MKTPKEIQMRIEKLVEERDSIQIANRKNRQSHLVFYNSKIAELEWVLGLKK